MNRAWHEAHPMPNKATLDQRVDWHIEHARECGCRKIPESVRAELARRGIALPGLAETDAGTSEERPR